MSETETQHPSGETAAERDRFNNFIAVAVALVSGFMAVSKIKDDNVVQAMQKAQTETVDYWNEYQARRLRQFTAEMIIDQTRATQPSTPALEEKIAAWKKQADTFGSRAEEAAAKAKARSAAYEAGNDIDDLFDLSDAMLSLSLALFAVTALVRVHWLFGLAAALALGGMTFGVAGFGGWTALHPTFLTSLLN